MKFRQHRGSLADAMETACEIETLQDLLDLITKELAPYQGPEPILIDETTVTLELISSHPDERIGWKQTWMVLLKGYGPFGWTDGSFSTTT